MTSFTAAELYERHSAELVRFASSLVDPTRGPDVVADVFVEIIRRQPIIDQPRAYLYRAVYNRAVSHYRRAGREVPASDHPELETRPATTEQSAQWLEPYLESLSEQQRAVLFLRYVEDMTPDSIARILVVSEGSVKRQLARIHRKIAQEGVMS
jgi:RNA polymerase sigma-70 factor (ECF subfamily)